jgi:hypothetical protein
MTGRNNRWHNVASFKRMVAHIHLLSCSEWSLPPRWPWLFVGATRGLAHASGGGYPLSTAASLAAFYQATVPLGIEPER